MRAMPWQSILLTAYFLAFLPCGDTVHHRQARAELVRSPAIASNSVDETV